MIDDTVRGVPPGSGPVRLAEIGSRGWRPVDGVMALPVLTLDEAAFAANRSLMLAYVRENGIEIAPHAKTPMVPELARSLVAAGAWGTTVADIRQASVMLRAGLNRLIVANEVGGAGGARRLAALLANHPGAQVHVFVDSPAGVAALAAAWRDRPEVPPLHLLVEVGAGRAGARTRADAAAVIEAIGMAAQSASLRLAGVGTYEGTAASADPEATAQAISALLTLAAEVFADVRAAAPGVPLILTAGGSVHFDRVVSALKPVAEADPLASLVLRSGAIFFHDHGVYQRGLEALDARGGFRLNGRTLPAAQAFRPALRIWAEVLSRPEAGLALCGMGMRDVSFDHDLPRPLRAYRNAEPLAEETLVGARVTRLNDQHAFLAIDPSCTLAVGDIVEFGVSHPCTCLDRWSLIYTLDETGTVSGAFRTAFG